MTESDDADKPASDELREVVREMFSVRADLYRATQIMKEAERVLGLVLPHLEQSTDVAEAVTALMPLLELARRSGERSLSKPHEPPVPDGPPTAEQVAAIASLSTDHVTAMDAAILTFMEGRSWTKVARVVGEIMRSDAARAGIPDVYYSSRVRALVDAGALASKGDLMRMRCSEVRAVNEPGH